MAPKRPGRVQRAKSVSLSAKSYEALQGLSSSRGQPMRAVVEDLIAVASGERVDRGDGIGGLHTWA